MKNGDKARKILATPRQTFNHLKPNKKMFVKVLGTLRLLSKCSFEFMNLNLMNLLLETHRTKNVYFFISNISNKDGANNTFYN